jgi:hypothetical protein
VIKLDKGFEINTYEQTDKEIYDEPKRGIASSKEEVEKYFEKWMKKDGKGFSFD